MDFDAIPRQNFSTRTRQNGDCIDVELLGDKWTLDEISSEIWDLIDGERTLADIAQEIQSRYPEVGLDTVSADLADLARDMLDKRLIALN